MPDQYTEVTRTGWGKRLGSSFGGILLGIILFFASFAVLFWNEGRVDVSNIAKNATPIDANSQPESSLNGTFVAATGALTTSDMIGDEYVAPGNYLSLDRNVEVYAWVEEQKSESEVKLGGAEETKTTYSYVQQWVSSAANSANFKIPGGHQNVQKTIEDLTATAQNARVGILSVDTNSLGMPGGDELTLASGMVTLPFNARLSGNYISVGSSPENPQIGDMRMSYSVLRSGASVTVFGTLQGQGLTAFVSEDGTRLYRATPGTFAEGVAQMHGEYRLWLWVLRLVGFLMMWFGLGAVFGPLSVLLDVLPIAGKISRGVVSLATLIVSLALSIVTVIVSMIVHNVLALIVVIVGGIVFTIWYVKKRGAKMGKKAA